MSRLRARCPDCKANTAVALGPEYECHSCGREFHSGLVRVPRAWGRSGEAVAEAARLEVPFPETGVVAEASLADQNLVLAAELPERPLVLGGCCCAHVGAVQALAARHDRLALVWLDAHGDLNTPATSPSGNAWGMPLRMLLDSGAVAAEDAVLVGARNLDPPERDFIAASGIRADPEELEVDCVYVAFDADVLDPADADPFMPEPDGLRVGEAEELLRGIAARSTVVGAGFTGLRRGARNAEVVARLAAALGL